MRILVVVLMTHKHSRNSGGASREVDVVMS